MTRALLVVAVLATVYATASYITDFPTDFDEASAIVAVLALGGVFALQERGRL